MLCDTLDAVGITEHLRDLQDEKRKLETKLEHLRVRRKDLEMKYEAVAKKNLNLNQKNDSMKRTVNVAKMKVEETKMQVDKYQENSDELQKGVNELKDKIQNEENKKDVLLSSFLEKYDEMCDRFRSAKTYYTDDKLIEENSRWKTSCEKKIYQARENEELIKTISERLSQVKLRKENEVPEEKPATSLWQQFNDNKDTLIAVIKENERTSAILVDKITDRTKAINTSLAEVEERLCRLKQEISEC